jgi:predicted ATPase
VPQQGKSGSFDPCSNGRHVDQSSQVLQIRLFGPPQLCWNDVRLRFGAPPRALSLLAYLLLYRAQPLTRETVAFALWPDEAEAAARSTLRRYVYYLVSRALPARGETPWIVGDKRTLQWNPAAPLWLDVAEFESLASDENRAAEAVELYMADLAEGIDDEWLRPLRDQLREQQCALLTKLVDSSRARGDRRRAIEYALRLLRHDPWREDAVRALMALRQESGDRAGALQTYRDFSKRLRVELEVEPMTETAELYGRIAEPVAELTASLATARPSVVWHNLPMAFTSFLGRERKIEALRALLLERRLVTLTGTGGVGKTRLAVETARTLIESFPEGVWLVEFAPVADPEMVPARIAAVLGLEQSPGTAILETIGTALRERATLLVLDNCEHVLDAAAVTVARLLADCPQVRILATSREPLHLSGERVERLESLAVPQIDGEALASLEELREVPAVKLFLNRAADVAPSLVVRDDGDERRALATVCRRLDGIPLAIELAASRMSLLTISALAERLENRFRLLVGGSRTVLPRQQTLRATLDWSFDLLSVRERTVFGRLGIFVAGWTLEAAQHVCSDALIAEADIFELLSSLVDKSLVVVQTEGTRPRYRMLETMRAYALEGLAEHSRERERTASRHAHYFLAFAEHADATFGSVPILRSLAPLGPELDNFRAALGWSLAERCDTELGVRLAAALGLVFGRLALYAEGERWCSRALAEIAEHPSAACEADLYRALFFYAYFSRTPDEMLAAGRRAVDLYRELGERSKLAYVLALLGFALHQIKRTDEADRATAEAVAIAREEGDHWHIAFVLCYRALTIDSTEIGARRALLDESVRLWGNLGEDASVELLILSLVAFAADDLLRALRWARESLAGYRRLNFRGAIAMCQVYVAAYSLAAGDVDVARNAAREALVIARGVNSTKFVPLVLQYLARVAALRGQIRRAARLLGASDVQHGALGWMHELHEQSGYAQTLAILREALSGDQEELATLMAEGRAWSFEQAAEEALLV